MVKAKCSLVCTVLNEEKTIDRFIQSIANQTLIPSEIIIVDGGSTDKTVKKIKDASRVKKINIKVITKKGNRSVGRNEAIKNCKYEIVLITDSGCELQKDWVKNIFESFVKGVDVVAGYYKGKYENIFQKSLVPYVLVMPDKINPDNFLPATRSMGIRKKVWKKIKGFDEKLSHNEDYVFANKLKENGFSIKFNQKAIVYWQPRSNLSSAFNMFFRFAYGDIEAGILREKVFWLFFRYLIGLYLLILIPIMKSLYLTSFIGIGLVTYLIWSVLKNYKYVQHYKAFIYLPIIQFTADLAVISGSLKALVYKIRFESLFSNLIKQKSLLLIIIGYTIICLLQINWGIPGHAHPFNYFMDEWHQSQSVRNLFKFGSPNIAGSANGSIFHFFLSGLYLAPFMLLGIINPFVIKSSVLNIDMQDILFITLRTNTIMFGIFSIIAFNYLCKRFLKINSSIATLFFVFNPMWLMLSNYFKYDIALMFWTLIAFIFMFRYLKSFRIYDYYLACLFSSLALAVKLSPFALIPVLGLLILFNIPREGKLVVLIKGTVIYVITFLNFGVIDILLGKGSLNEYLSSTLSRTPDFNAANILIANKIWPYLTLDLFPVLFGHAFYITGLLGLLILISLFLKNLLSAKNKTKFLFQQRIQIVFLIIFLFFAFSLVPLKLDASNNRVLILIPFMAYLFGYLFGYLFKNFNKSLVMIFVLFLIVLQVAESTAWLTVKLSPDPRQLSSAWIVNNLPTQSLIGLQNIPIYQGMPDIVINEFYKQQYKVPEDYHYKYKIIQSNNKNFPTFIVLSNVSIETQYKSISETKDIKNKLSNQGYRLIKEFKPNFKYLFIFTNPLNYYMAAIIQSPVDISIYEKSK